MYGEAIWNALDATITSTVPATLAGLSITTTSLLANLSRTQLDTLNDLEDKKYAKQRERDEVRKDRSSDDDDKQSAQDAFTRAEKKYCAQVNLVSETYLAMRRLLVAFYVFAADLCWTLTADPILSKEIFNERKSISDPAYLSSIAYDWGVPADVVLSVGGIGFGLLMLWKAAKHMKCIAPTIVK